MELHEYTDKALCRIVWREIIDRNKCEWSITACLTRFGGLCVLVTKLDDGSDVCWQGDNVCEARKWLDDYTEADPAR